MHVVVIGAGVVGTTTALALVERGLEVTLIERHAIAAEETSHANGGGITPGHAEPWNSPGILGRLLTRSGAGEPFRIYPRSLPGLVPWGIRFLANSTSKRYYRNARNNTRLAVYSGQCLRRLRERFGLEYDHYTEGSLELYFSRAELDHALELRHRIGDPGVTIRTIGVDEVVAREPALAPVADRLAGAMLLPLHESGDACRFSIEVAARAEQLGAMMRFRTQVRAIRRPGRWQLDLHHAEAGAEALECDAIVLAAGCGSRALAWPLGLKLPIFPVKGYSATLELERPELAPTVPLLDLEHRIVTARFGDRLRMAGLADFEGDNRSVRPERVQCLLESSAALLPRLADEIRSGRAEAWAGLRPMTPQGPPLLGPTRISDLFLNTGHGSMGWTQAAGSAEIIADLVAGQSPAIDMAGLLPAERGA